MTTFTIQSGQTSTLVLNSGDVCVVQSGGTALDTIVNNGAVLRVSGGVASGALVNNGGVETIADGSDIGTTVNSGGLYITRRPFGKLITISDTVFNSGGSGEVTDAANVTSVQVRNGASLTLQSLVADVTVSGLFIESGGSVAASQLVRKLSLQGVEVGGLLRLLRDQGDAPIPLSGAVVFSSGGRLEDDFIPRHGGFVDPVSGIVRNPVSAAFAAAVISGLTVGATLDLAGVPWEGNISATLLPNNVLHIVEGSGILDLQLDPSQDFTGKSFKLSYLQSPNRGIPSGGTRVTLVSGSISQQQVSSLLIIGSGESSDGLAVDSGGSVGVNSGGSAADVVLDTPAIWSLNFGAFASGVFDGGGLVLVGPGATLVGVTASGGGILNASAGAVIVGAHIIGDGAESVFGTDSAGFIDSGGTQSVSSGGSAVDTVVAAGGQQIIQGGGTGTDIVVQPDGSVVITDGGAIVGSTTVGGTVELSSGAVVSGVISFSRGGVLQIDSPAHAVNYFPTSARLGNFGADDVIDLRLVNFDSKGSVSVVSGNELKVTENGINYLFGLRSSLIGGQLHLSPDGAGGSMITVMPPNPILFAGTDSAGRNQLWRTDGTPSGTTEITSGTGFGGGIFSNTSPGLLQLRNEVIFNGKDANGRNELWRTDGTPTGTSELTVTGGAIGGLAPSDFVPIDKGGSGNGGAIFVANGADGKVNPWVTDGTGKGTSELSVAGASPDGLSPTDLLSLGKEVVFTGIDSHFRSQIWVTDGTKIGTKEISVAGLSNPHNYVAMQVAGFEKTFFNGTATFGLQVPNLWVTNLTAAGTSEFSVPGQSSAGLDPQDLTFGDLTLIAKYAFLNGVDANSDRNLFVTQGTQVTTSEILVPGVTALNPTNMFAFGGLVLLDGTDANGHRNLFESNGTSAGTSEITIPGIASLDPSNFAALNNSEVLFQGDGASGGRVLYRLNTVDLGAVEISVPGGLSTGLQPSNITPNAAILKSFFTGAGSALWVTDGASAGTSELSIGINPIDLTVMNSELLFNAADATSKHGLWVSDGTSAGTSELSVAGAAPSGLDPKNLFVVGSEALFAGTDAGGHQNLWITDGPAGGTSELSVAEANSEGLFSNSTVPSFTLFGSEILFAGMDAARSSDVFANPGLFVATVTSGTVGGISELLPPFQADPHGISPSNFAVFNGEVLFQGFDDNGGDEQLWATDGTADGTSEIATGGAGGLQPTQLTVLSGTVVFAGVDFTNKHGLWATNGALGGTSEILSTNAPGGGLNPTDLTVFGSKVLFAGKDNSANNNLWVTDGTSAGTSELTVSGVHSGGIFFSAGHATNPGFTVLPGGGKVLFNGVDSGGNAGLWVTDGTIPGTSELSIAGAAATGLNPNNFSVSGSDVLFEGTDSSGRQNLWITDGTPAGTSEVFSVVIPNLTPTALTTFFTGPSVTGVSSPQTGQDLKAGAFVTINLALDEVAKVTGTPKLLLNDGGSASYLSGSNTATLTFKYTVAPGQNIADLKVTSASLNGGSVTDSGGRAADFSGVLGADLGIVIDTKAPTISSITPTPTSGGTVGLGGTVAIDVHLSEAAVVSGTPTLRLNDGGTAFYVPGGSSNPAGGVLEFDYTVGSGQNTPDLTISSLSLLGGASITDSAGNAVNPTLPASKNLHLTIDSIRPSVTSATATPGGVASGGTATITLKMSQPVSVGGSGPVLDLNDGGSATYVSGGGTTSLTFRYVAGGEATADLKIIGIESAGTVTGSAGNALSPSLSADLKTTVNTDSWKTGKSGIFGAGSNWTATSAPTSGQEAVIAVAGTYTVSAISGATVAALDIANKTATLLVTSGATFTATKGTGPDANLGTVVVQSGGIFAPGGTFHNSGSLKAATGGDIVLGGTVANGSAGVILASGAGAHVDLDGATISGGIVKAVSHGVLNVTGGTIGSGTLVETLSGGSAIISGTLANSGTLLASALGSLIEIAGVVSGGAVTVGNGIVDVLSGGTANIAFLSTGSGALEIADTLGSPNAFTGTISGFGGVNHTNHKQFIDLVSVTSAAHTISFSYTSATGSGTLTVSSGGTAVASIDLVGAYTSSSFHLVSGISGTVAITDPEVVNGGSVELGPVQALPGHGVDLPDLAFGGAGTLAYAQTANAGNTLTVPDGRHAATIALLVNYMAGNFALTNGNGAALVTQQTEPQPLLAHPHAG